MFQTYYYYIYFILDIIQIISFLGIILKKIKKTNYNAHNLVFVTKTWTYSLLFLRMQSTLAACRKNKMVNRYLSGETYQIRSVSLPFEDWARSAQNDLATDPNEFQEELELAHVWRSNSPIEDLIV